MRVGVGGKGRGIRGGYLGASGVDTDSSWQSTIQSKCVTGRCGENRQLPHGFTRCDTVVSRPTNICVELTDRRRMSDGEQIINTVPELR